MSYTLEQMQAIFTPRSVAVVGAPRSFKPGLVFLQALLDPGFKGEVFPINPNADEILGLKAYPSVSAIPRAVDMAIALVSVEQINEVLEDCARKGVKAVIVFTSGFGETGDPAGVEREREMVAAARAGNVRLVGPNCMGVYCPESGLGFFPSMPTTTGSVAFVSQSGSLSAFVTLMGTLRGMSFSKVVSIGNECDLSSSDFIEYLGEDEKTRIVAAYLEGTRNGPALMRALRRTSLKKPVIIWKSGGTSTGARAVASHTGSLAGSDAVWDAAFRQTGAIRAQSLEEMIDIATAFYYIPETTGRRFAIVSGPGGPAVAAADALDRNGLLMARLDEETIAKLRKIIPPSGASMRNPVDLGVAPWAIISIYSDTLGVVDADENVNVSLLIGGGLTPSAQQEYLDSMLALKPRLRKPCMLISLAGFTGDIEFSKKLQSAGYPLYASPERAISAYAKVVRYYEWKRKVSSES
ncbi:MAG: CoA-binding protein [Candidatus Lindowbacteria bacterium]|nr:CoA-binding protein [Candidatus Lindowbacteria bacterium]